MSLERVSDQPHIQELQVFIHPPLRKEHQENKTVHSVKHLRFTSHRTALHHTASYGIALKCTASCLIVPGHILALNLPLV